MSSEAAGHKTGGEKKEKKKSCFYIPAVTALRTHAHTHTRENPNKAGKGKIHKEQLKEI